MNGNKNRILFFCEAVTLAHSIRSLVLAQGLDSNKYDIIFACDKRRAKFILDEGYKVINIYSQTQQNFLKRLYYGMPLYDSKLIDKYIEEEIRILDEVKPDLVVGDFRLTLGISARLKRIPYATITNFHWSIYSKSKPILPYMCFTKYLGFKVACKLFNYLCPLFMKVNYAPYSKKCKEYGLKIPSSIYEMYCDADYVLYEDSYNVCGYHSFQINKTHFFLGPILWEPSIVLPKELGTKDKDIKTVYLSIGTSGVLSEKVINVLIRKGYNVLMSTATNNNDKNRYPSNIHVYEYLPALKILEKADLAIVNAGMARYQALSKGVPSLMFPSNMDQFIGAEEFRIKKLGLYLRHDIATEEDIELAIDKLLTDKTIHTNLKIMKYKLQGEDAQKIFNKFLNRIFN